MPQKPSTVRLEHMYNTRRSEYNPKAGDTKLMVSFYDDQIQIYAQAWYEESDCSDGAHGWAYASGLKHGEDGEAPAFRQDCGNADINEAQVKKLHAALGEWLALRRAMKAKARVKA